MLTAVEIIGQTLTTDVWTSYDDPMSKLTFLNMILFYTHNYIYVVQALLNLLNLQ